MSLVPHYCSRCGQKGHHPQCPPRREGIDLLSLSEQLPIPMILYCPVCQMQHIDAPNPEIGWEDPPHKSHECQGCKAVWRPCDLATTGVRELATRGKSDTWPMGKEPQAMPAAKMDAPDGPVCWCGAPSTRMSGWCGRPECDSVSLDSLKRRCICPWGLLRGDCPEHGDLVP